MASCSQSFFLHKKQNFAKCEQGLILENMSTLHRAYLGADKQTFEGGGGGGDFRNILQTDSEEKKNCCNENNTWRKKLPILKNIVHRV